MSSSSTLVSVNVPKVVWRCSGLCRALYKDYALAPPVDVPVSLCLHPDIVAWCTACGLSDATLAHELYVIDGPVHWVQYLGTVTLEKQFTVSITAQRMLQQWWQHDIQDNNAWGSHWVLIMRCADYWQIDSLYWRMLAMVHRRYDELTPDNVEALVGVRPAPVPHLGASPQIEA